MKKQYQKSVSQEGITLYSYNNIIPYKRYHNHTNYEHKVHTSVNLIHIKIFFSKANTVIASRNLIKHLLAQFGVIN